MTLRQEKIKHLIETSSLLDPAERQEWLDILESMNDKQLLDLENILKPEPVASAPLSHIANLPKGLHLGVSSKPAPSPASAKWLDDMKLVLSEKELPAGHPAQEHLLPEHAGKSLKNEEWSMEPKVQQPPSPPFRQPAETGDSARVGTTAGLVKDSQPETEEFDTGARVPANWEPSSSADAVLLSVAIFRNIGPEKIIQSLQAFVRKEGYSKVLVNLEKSNLYKAYLAAGHNFLSSGKTGSAQISKEEFEEIVDILRKIQVN